MQTVDPTGTQRTSPEEVGCDHFEQTLALVDGLLDAPSRPSARAHAGSCAVCGPLVEDWSRVREHLLLAFDDAAERAKPDLAGVADQVLARIDPPQQPRRSSPFAALRGWMRRYRPLLVAGLATAALALVILPRLDEGETFAPQTAARIDTEVLLEAKAEEPSIPEPPQAVALAEEPEVAAEPPADPAPRVTRKAAPKATKTPPEPPPAKPTGLAGLSPQTTRELRVFDTPATLEDLPEAPEFRLGSSAPPRPEPMARASASRVTTAEQAPSTSVPRTHELVMQHLSFEASDGMVYRTSKEGMTVIWIHEHDGA